MKVLLLALLSFAGSTATAQIGSTAGGNIEIGTPPSIADAGYIGTSSMLSCTPSCKAVPVRIFITDETVDESAGVVYLTLSIAPSSWQTVSVNYKTVNGSAKQLKDYLKASGTLSFLPGEAFKKIPVAIISDNEQESQENLFVELSQPVNAVLGDGSGTIRINDVASVASRSGEHIPIPFSATATPNPSTGTSLHNSYGVYACFPPGA